MDRIRKQYLPLLYHPEETPTWAYCLVVVVERAAMACEGATLRRPSVAIVEMYVGLAHLELTI